MNSVQNSRWPGALVCLLMLGCSEPGIDLTLTNGGTAGLDSVVVHTTGYSYPIGDLAAGATRELKVQSTGESDIAVEHGPGDLRRRVVLGVYFEERYREAVTARVTADTVLSLTRVR